MRDFDSLSECQNELANDMQHLLGLKKGFKIATNTITSARHH